MWKGRCGAKHSWDGTDSVAFPVAYKDRDRDSLGLSCQVLLMGGLVAMIMLMPVSITHG